ncbi:MAG TPA: hypothetical protein VMW04_04580 [Patescibacteria group bacterium]|nr:hypothetical protein [Patescibacteria group bacterium]
MEKRTSVLIIFLLLIAAFLAGSTAAKIKYFDNKEEGEKLASTAPAAQPTLPPFEPKKTDKPEVKFFVMSFCPYGNQAEAGLEPVYQLLKDKVSWQPQYIVADQKASCEQNCPHRVYDDNAKKRCEDAVAQGQVGDVDTCKGYFPYTSTEECLSKECAKLTAGKYESLHGDQELHQDIREICAFAETQLSSAANALDKWWKFVDLVNQNCNSDNADICWTAQAETVGFNTGRILSCSQSQAKSLLAKEVAEVTKYRATGSPTFYINEVLYQGGRAPEDLKKAICSSFNELPLECSQTLGQESAASTSGCGN